MGLSTFCISRLHGARRLYFSGVREMFASVRMEHLVTDILTRSAIVASNNALEPTGMSASDLPLRSWAVVHHRLPVAQLCRYALGKHERRGVNLNAALDVDHGYTRRPSLE